MHDFALPVPPCGAAFANSGSHPDSAGANTPAAESFRKSRRVFSCRRSLNMGFTSLGVRLLL
jgi:hypothetical protein